MLSIRDKLISESQTPIPGAPEPFMLRGPVEGDQWTGKGSRSTLTVQSPSVIVSPGISPGEGSNQPTSPSPSDNNLQAEVREMQARMEMMNREMSRYLVLPAYESQPGTHIGAQ
jgi:hypothetical protein